MIATVACLAVLVIAGMVGYRYGKMDAQGEAKRVEERLRRQCDHLFETQAEERQRLRRLGQEEGRRAALSLIVKDKTQETSYRTAAARLLKCCPFCSRQCIHCAREGSEHDAA